MGIISCKNFAVLTSVTAFGWCFNLWAKCTSEPKFHPTSGTYLQCIIDLDGERKIFDGARFSLEDCKNFCKKRHSSVFDAKCITPASSFLPQISQAEEIIKSLKKNTKLRKQLRRGDLMLDFKTVGNKDQNSQAVSNKYQVTTSNSKFMMSFHRLFEEIKKRNSENPCKAAEDKTWLRERALVLMNEALASFGISKPVASKADDATDENQFNTAMVHKWRSLISWLANNPKTLPPVSKGKTEGRMGITIGHVRDSLKNGVIPLPHFLEETFKKQDHFSYTSLSQYFFYGIAPVSLRMTPNEEILKRPDHPLRHSLLSSVYDLMDHDLQHASKFISKIYQEYKIEDRNHCEKFFDCLDKIPNIKDKKKSKDLRLALFYLLHEDANPLSSRLGDTFDPLSFAEFSMERLIQNQKKFNIQELIGTGNDREKFCIAVRTVQSSLNNAEGIITLPNYVSEDPIKKIDEATPFLSEIFPTDLDNTFRSQMSKIINKSESMSIQESDRIMDERKHVSDLKRSLLRSLGVTCSPELAKIEESKNQNESLDEAKSYLTSRFAVWEKNGFHNELLSSSKNLATNIGNLIGYFQKDRKCRDILRRSK